jgi:membrane protease YdiL (CAAX protease family)
VEFLLACVVLLAVILLMRFESLRFAGWQSSVFIGIPLVAAIARNLPMSELGLRVRKPLADLKAFGLACGMFLPVAAIVYYLWWRLCGTSAPAFRLPGRFGRELAVNFLYFALPEELLFRGYMQQRLSRVLPRTFRILKFELPLAGVICAALFAGAHVLYEVSIYRVLVFFPALVFAWLRHRTGSIVAPTLFHGTCNMAVLFTGFG